MNKKLFTVALLLFVYFAYASSTFSSTDPDRAYGEILGRTIDDVVRNIHSMDSASPLSHVHVMAIMCQELPSLRINQRNYAGYSYGLMQVTDRTSKALLNGQMVQGRCTYINNLENGECSNPKARLSNIRCSIELGACLLNDILKRCRGDMVCVFNEYNQGDPRKPAVGLSKYVAAYNAIVQGQLCPQAKARPVVWQELFSTVKKITGGVFDPSKIIAASIPNSPWAKNITTAMLSGEYQENPQSFWGSLLSKTGFGKWFSQDSGHGTSYQSTSGSSDSSGSNNSIYKGDYFYQDDKSDAFSEDFSKLSSFDAEYENTQYNQGTLESENSKYSGAFLHCLPTTLEKGEPFLISYSCPTETESVETKGFESKTLKALLKMSAKESKLFEVSCKKSGVNIKLKCQSKVINPAILEFSIKPSNPNIGDLITVTWSTQDFKSCKLTNKDKSLLRSALSGEAVFELDKNSEKLSLLCETETGRIISKEIEI